MSFFVIDLKFGMCVDFCVFVVMMKFIGVDVWM